MTTHTEKALAAFVFCALLCSCASVGSRYYPPSGDDWARRSPQAVGLDAALLDRAISFAMDHETTRPRDLAESLKLGVGAEPFSDPIGPTKIRAGSTGVVVRHGYLVAEWGEPKRADMTFSVTKSFLSTTAGLAVDRGLIADVHDPVREYVQDGGFDSPHNSRITWHHLLNQTSSWEGTLWGKPDWADRWGGRMRELHEPGTFWRYNDVRVNRLALALLQVWREPLPRVLKREIMDPIGASPTWRWHGYENSWVTIDGTSMQSVAGGGHWGGGMFISARDMARFGHLWLRRGRWEGEQLVSESWFRRITTPTSVRPTYGYMNFYLNTDRELFPSAPEGNFFLLGSGRNMIWVDPQHDMVVVVRWINSADTDGFIERVLQALEG